MDDYKNLIPLIDKAKMPKHIGVIMDGNGRWAKRNKASRLQGHQQGVKTVRNIVEASVEIELEYLTVYAFSTENWRRSKQEVHGLLRLIMDSLIKEIDELTKNNIVVKFIGSRQGIDPAYYEKIQKNCSKSWGNDGLTINVAMNYGGKQEIIDMVKQITNDCQKGVVKLDEIDERLINNYLYTKEFPDPDLLIRTSGEYRLSNFLIWQAAYAELWFTDTLWPDFSKKEYIQAILDYQKRKRRFGAEE
ncbi:MAG: isoprenyl transferase [Candidatus Cloacimonas sp.]|nr:isoprenyl transferase [Candidatus Cloacimonadota bacterium]